MYALIIAALMASQTPIPKKDGYQAIGGAVWGQRQPMTSANTTYDIELVNGTVPACFAHRTIVVVKAMGGEAVCAWTDDPTAVAFTNNVDAEDACELTDSAGPDGMGACFPLSDTERHDQSRFPVPLPIGGRGGGICSTPRLAPGGAMVYVPCDDDTDCSTAGAGSTCDEDLSAADIKLKRQQGCSFLICQGDTAGMYIGVTVEQ